MKEMELLYEEESKRDPEDIMEAAMKTLAYSKKMDALCQRGLEWLQLAAQNPLNDDSFRAVYKMIGDLVDVRRDKINAYVEVEGGVVQGVYSDSWYLSVEVCDRDSASQEDGHGSATEACRKLDGFLKEGKLKTVY